MPPGKPAAADLRLSLATAPVLFASQQFPKLRGLVARRFRRAGDVEAALALVVESEGLQRTRELAGSYSEAAVTSTCGGPGTSRSCSTFIFFYFNICNSTDNTRNKPISFWVLS